MELSPMQKNLVLYDYYYGDESPGIIPQKSEVEAVDTYRVSSEFFYMGTAILGVSGNGGEGIEIERKAGGEACEMVFDMTVPHTGLYLKVYYAGQEEDYSEEKTAYVYLVEGNRTYSVYMENNAVEKVKIIPVYGTVDKEYGFAIQGIHFVDWVEKYDDIYVKKAKEMSEKSVFNVGFDHDEYRAYCVSEDEGNMLMIPLSYSINWSAYINGEKVKVQKINDGFCGIELPEGECQVVMQYKTAGKTIWTICSFVCALILIIYGAGYRKSR